MDKQPEQPKKKNFMLELYDTFASLVASITIICLVFTFVVFSTSVDGGSMEPGLHDGDKLLVASIPLSIKRGDIVMVRNVQIDYMTGKEKPIIKRVIAVAGDTIDINFVTGEVTVNGEVLEENYILELTTRPGDIPTIFPMEIPAGEIFVMGDNRNHSTDSREELIGSIDVRDIIGKYLFRFWHTDKKED